MAKESIFRKRIRERLAANKKRSMEGDPRMITNCGGTGGTMGPCAGGGGAGGGQSEGLSRAKDAVADQKGAEKLSKAAEKASAQHSRGPTPKTLDEAHALHSSIADAHQKAADAHTELGNENQAKYHQSVADRSRADAAEMLDRKSRMPGK